ncbi:hypothetical protein [Halomonas lysinitropha]|uniref:Two-component sensor histidine kinase n=1 Tax=Halomonas lysinitropha TaxID=2607506 RepID=A0A5K1I8D8_9GAMM|nr:hypothetical protein [Halomonas lysinitropha]VVZ96467.1 hypothetical protein HALO32_02567 [Halomonas lysinitropha]
MIRVALIRALQILSVAAALVAIYSLSAWLTAIDRQVERASLEAYCTGVAVWSAEESRGIAPERRTGHPDYDERAAEDCPGMRPAGLNITTERQLARN